MYHDPKHPNHKLGPLYDLHLLLLDSVSKFPHRQGSQPIFCHTFQGRLSFTCGSGDRQFKGEDDVDWLHLLHPFSAVQTLHVSWELAGHVALALEDIPAEIVTEVLPSLCLTYLEGHSESSLGKFVAARELSDSASDSG